MLDPSGDAKPANYSREDDSARRLWLTQRTKANPWDHRTDNPDGESAPAVQAASAIAPREAAAPTLIPQQDQLQLEVRSAQQVENPFARLVLHRRTMRELGE